MKFKLLLLIQVLFLGQEIHAEADEGLSCDEVSGEGDGVKGTVEEEFGKRDEEGYQWPNIYEEADDMLDASLLMYPIAELRRVAREHPEDFNDPGDILQEPITAEEAEKMLVENTEVLSQHFAKETLGVLSQVMEALIDRQDSVGEIKRKPMTTLVNFADDNSNSELVYAIGTDDTRKRVTVSFRGSVTKADWLQDFQIWMEKVDNPLYAKGIKDQPEKIRIHHGFYEYLFYTTTSGETREDGQLKSKYERIIAEAVELLEKNPGYKLFVTGHSLGAALASVFAFMAAASEDRIPSPVTCISIASPFVGDAHFKRSFQSLENTGRLRYLRVANHKDMITVMPFVSLNLGLYKHVGMELRLYPEKHLLSYPIGQVVNRVLRNSLFGNLSLDAARNHSPKEYNQRLDLAHAVLQDKYLNDLYKTV